MDYMLTALTDVGLVKKTNQDSLLLRTADCAAGRVCFAVLCDGMGGLAKGELASAEVIHAFGDWFVTRFPALAEAGLQDGVLRAEWTALVNDLNRRIQTYGRQNGIQLGTTITAALITPARYYILNVGDSRAYLLSDALYQLTEDQSYVQNLVRRGEITPEEALTHPQRNVLLQCIGASENVFPDMYFGDTRPGQVFMLCCDGFRHEIQPEEFWTYLNPLQLADEPAMRQSCQYLIDLNKYRQETDNITVAVIKTV